MVNKHARALPAFFLGLVLLSPASFALQETAEIEENVLPSPDQVIDQRWRAGAQVIPGGVTHGTESVIINQMDKLLGAALAQDPNTTKYEKAVTHYRKKSQRAKAATADAVNAIVPYTGFSHSSEAGDIILDEKLKLCSRSSAEYARQRNVDEKQRKITTTLMQIATGFGSKDWTQVASVTSSGIKRLQELSGEQAATEAFETIKKWQEETTVPEAVFLQKMWLPEEQEQKLQTIVTKALERDQLVQSIQKQVYKFNHMSTAKRAAGKVVRTTLGAACMTPTVIGPAAQVGLTVFEVATGGPEESKLLKELYLMKRLESRSKVLSNQAQLALNNYQIGVLTKNPAQIAMSELLINDLVGPDFAAQIIQVPVLDSTKSAVAPLELPAAVEKRSVSEKLSESGVPAANVD